MALDLSGPTTKPTAIGDDDNDDVEARGDALIREARQRQRRRRLLLAGICLLVAVLALGLAWGVFGGGNNGSGGTGSKGHSSGGNIGPGQSQSLQSTSSRPVMVDAAATPSGWVAVPFGDIQISVPASWLVLGEEADVCGPPPENAGVVLINGTGWCGPNARAFDAPATPPVMVSISVAHPGSDERPEGKAQRINGIWVQPVVGGSWWIRSVGVTLTIKGTNASAILRTLTYSPRAAVLSGPPATLPSKWHQVTIGALRFNVPRTWKIRTTINTPCEGDPEIQLLYQGVLLIPSLGGTVPSCPPLWPTAFPETNGVEVDAWNHQPVRANQCLPSPRMINSLSVCILGNPADDSLDMVVTAQNGTRVHMELGLAGTGHDDKIVLYSLRPS